MSLLTVKRFKKVGSKIELHAENEEFSPIVVDLAGSSDAGSSLMWRTSSCFSATDSLHQMLSPNLRDRLDDILKAKNDLGELGNFEKITSEQSVEAKQKGELLVASEVVALYEKRSVTYTISFNESGQMVGIYMK